MRQLVLGGVLFALGMNAAQAADLDYLYRPRPPAPPAVDYGPPPVLDEDAPPVVRRPVPPPVYRPAPQAYDAPPPPPAYRYRSVPPAYGYRDEPRPPRWRESDWRRQESGDDD